MSCLGRERLFDYFSRAHGTPVAILRLNYAAEMRYGVLIDLAGRVFRREPIDLTMGYFNVIWQADANAMALAALAHTSSPPLIVNLAGPEELSVRATCIELARLLGVDVSFTGRETKDAVLSNGARARAARGASRGGRAAAGVGCRLCTAGRREPRQAAALLVAHPPLLFSHLLHSDTL